VRKGLRGIVPGICCAVLLASTAAAHVDVLPGEATVNEAQEFVVRVPVEREVATTRVKVTFPKQMVVVRFASAPGWTRRTIAAADGSISGVVYDGRVGRDEYAEFRLIATPVEQGSATWRVEQTSSDGIVKPWTGPPEEEGQASVETGPSDPGPAPVTRFVATASAAPAATGGTNNDSSPAGIWLGIIAICIAGAALTAVGFLWSTRPMVLPTGDALADEPSPATPKPPAPPKRPAAKRRRG
jgi:Domain of unkown function (DUF1775)